MKPGPIARQSIRFSLGAENTAAKMGIDRSSSAKFYSDSHSTAKVYGAISHAVTSKRRRETRKTEIPEEDRDGLTGK